MKKLATLATISALIVAMGAFPDDESMGSGSSSYSSTYPAQAAVKLGAANGHKLQKASDLIGKKITNLQREDLGEISDMLIDVNSWRVVYVVLSANIKDARNKLFIVPMSALQPQPGQDRLVLNIEKDRLKDAPGFDRDRLSDLTSREYGSSIHEYYGVAPYWEDSGSHPSEDIGGRQDSDLNEFPRSPASSPAGLPNTPHAAPTTRPQPMPEPAPVR